MILACRARISIIVAAADKRERASMSGMHGSVRRRDLPRRARAEPPANALVPSRRWWWWTYWMESTPNGGRPAGGSSSSRRLPHVLPSAPLVEASQHVLLQPHPGAFPLSLLLPLSLGKKIN